MRNPSLHITKSDFIEVLKQVMPKADCEGITEAIFAKAIPFHIKNRYLIKGNAATKKKAEKIINRTEVRSDFTVEQFNVLLSSIRMVRGHKHQQQLNKGTNDWLMLTDVFNLADQFVNTFEITNAREGFKAFIELGLDFMGKAYALNKFKSYASRIHKGYEAKMVLANDETPEDTKRFWATWCEVMKEYAGNVYDITKTAEKFIPMVYGKQEADEAGANYKDWITAQFEGLSFNTSLPELGNFYGENAKLRYDKYMTKQNSNTKAEKKRISEDVAVDIDDTHLDYFALLNRKVSDD